MRPFNGLKSTLTKCRNKGMPKSPLTVAEVQAAFEQQELMEKYGRIKGEAFYRGGVVRAKGEFSFCVFASETIVKALPTMRNKRYHVDATFSVVPNNEYVQMLVVHVEIDGHVSHIYFNEKIVQFYLIYILILFLKKPELPLVLRPYDTAR